MSKSNIAGGKVGSPIMQKPRKTPSRRKRTKPERRKKVGTMFFLGSACIMLGPHNQNKVISEFFGSVPAGSQFNLGQEQEQEM